MKFAQLSNSPKSRDQLTGRILELAHNVSPELASNLTPLVDNPHEEHLRRMQLNVSELTNNSKRLEDVQYSDKGEYQEILAKASHRMLMSLNSGSGIVRSDKDVGQWVGKMLQAGISESFSVVAWAIKNFQLSSKKSGLNSVLFTDILQTISVSHMTSTLLLQISDEQAAILNAALPDSLLSLQARAEVPDVGSAQSWIKSKAEGYLTLYDPFFNVSDLTLLTGVKEDIRVTVITSWKSQNVDADDSTEFVNTIQNKISESVATLTSNIQILVIGTASGDSPVYSRYIITASGALAFEERDTPLCIAKFTELTANEARQVEGQFVNQVFMPQFTQYNGERLFRHDFWIRPSE